MSRNQRITLIVAALAVALVAFLIARPGDDDEPEPSAATTAEQAETEAAEPQPTTEPEAQVTRIEIQGGAVAGGVREIQVARGDSVRIVVSSDAPDEIHLHGYDLTRNAAPGQPARFRFKADAEGVFEIESHTAEDAGLDPRVARLVVEPS